MLTGCITYGHLIRTLPILPLLFPIKDDVKPPAGLSIIKVPAGKAAVIEYKVVIVDLEKHMKPWTLTSNKIIWSKPLLLLKKYLVVSLRRQILLSG
jgi:hypothetical protein